VKQSSTSPAAPVGALDARRGGSPGWLLVLRRELEELWVSGRVLALLVLYAVLMSVSSLLREIESQVSLIPPKELVFIAAQNTIFFGLFIGVVVGADSISGERDRATLEPLLLTPTSRRQIILGKLLAALSQWPVAFLLSIPYTVILSRGNDILADALIWTAVLGTLVAVAFTGLGMLISIWSSSNRTSLLVSLFVYLFFFIPTQWPGGAHKGNLGYFIQQSNPLQGTSGFLEKFIVNNRTPQELIPYAVTQPLAAILVVAVLFLYAAPRLELQGEGPRMSLARIRAPRAARATIAGLLLLAALLPGAAAAASERGSSDVTMPPPTQGVAGEPSIEISIEPDHAVVNTGDTVDFETVVTNTGAGVTPRLVIAMNIINLGKGDPVDPEDWSPERTQEIDPLEAGAEEVSSWEVDAILEGDYMVYLTVVVQPSGAEASTQPIASRGLHLTAKPFFRTNPGGVLPIAFGIPILLAVGSGLSLMLRRRQSDGIAPPIPFLRPGVVAIGVVVAIAALSAAAIGAQPPRTSSGVKPGPSTGAVSPEPSTAAVSPEPSTSAEPSAVATSSPSPSGDASPSQPTTSGKAVELKIDTATEPETFTFAQKALSAPAGSRIKLTLSNLTDADDEIGHNWVLVKQGQEQSVLANGIKAGDDKDWLDVNDPGIIAATRLIEGGQRDSVTFDAPPAGTYTFVCTFPEHFKGGMRGTLTIG
jgi:ABC-2 type transport system permease protein